MERVSILVKLASKAMRSEDYARAKRYANLTGALISHYKLRKETHGAVCKSCGAPMEPGLTCDVRIASTRRQVLYRCRLCARDNMLHY